jgi:tRNA threonylcarbamoyladenosine biosynthesis protein TsaB
MLAIETSVRQASVALSVDGVVSAEALPRDQPTTQSLATTVQKLLQQQDVAVADLIGISVDRGPGSFTGLRVGLTFAKTLAYASGACLLGVTSLEVLAWAALERGSPPVGSSIVALLDAQRGQFYAAKFVVHANQLGGGDTVGLVLAPQIVDLKWLAREVTADSLLVGPVVERLLQAEQLPPEVQGLDCVPEAATLAALGARAMFGEAMPGLVVSDEPFSLQPLYLRLSAAEEKAAST